MRYVLCDSFLTDICTDKEDKQPAYDTNAEHTTMAAADVLYEVMSIMVKKGPLSKMIESNDDL